MIVIAGGIGSGKSVVSRILRLNGYGVFDCDYEAKRLMELDIRLATELKKAAGNDIYDGGILDRRLLAARIFSDKETRKMVNRAVHEAVKERIGLWLSDSPENIFVETAIAAESGIAAEADEIWLIHADVETRLQRVRLRDGREEGEILRIMEAQEREEGLLSDGTKPVVHISNNNDDELLTTLLSLLKKINVQTHNTELPNIKNL